MNGLWNPSYGRYHIWQQPWDLAVTGLLLLAALACAGLLAIGLSADTPLILFIIIAGLLCFAMLWRWPVFSVYLLVFSALLINQWPVPGIEPITDKTHLFRTLSSFTPVQLPMTPAEMILGVGLLAVLLPALGRRGSGFYRGSLFGPVIFFLLTVIASAVFGADRGTGTGPFMVQAAWAEARSFIYLVICYVLAANLITNRRRLHVVTWIIILTIGLKGLQGISHYLVERRIGVQLESITGHEDVIFFGTFFLLLAAMLLFGGDRRQRIVMLCLLAPVIFTELATSRRIAFFSLPFGLLIIGVGLFQTNRRLFFRIAPIVAILLVTYIGIFWNRTDTLLGEPARAFRSQVGTTSMRDERSDAWRDLERENITGNIRSAPLTGLGFGRPYRFYVPEPSLVSSGFIYWTYITHNAIYWVWMKMGAIGFIAFWLLLGSAIVQGLTSFRKLSDSTLRVLAITIAGLVVMQVIFSYGDLGLTYARPMIFLGCMLGVLVRLPDLDRAADHSRLEQTVMDGV